MMDTDLPLNTTQVHEVRAQDLDVFFLDNYPDANASGDASYELFQFPSSDTVHLVRAQEGLGEYDTKAAAAWLSGERGGDASSYPDGVFSYLAAEGKIPFGNYLVCFE
jgi:hypothetical protein